MYCYLALDSSTYMYMIWMAHIIKLIWANWDQYLSKQAREQSLAFLCIVASALRAGGIVDNIGKGSKQSRYIYSFHNRLSSQNTAFVSAKILFQKLISNTKKMKIIFAYEK